MPDRRKGESKDDFVPRCMSDAEAKRDFPDEDQRLAFCISRAGEKNEGFSTNQRSIGDWSIHVFDNSNDATKMAEELGIEGFHEHEIDGVTKFMPGSDHEIYNDAVELEPIANGDEEEMAKNKDKLKKKKIKAPYEHTDDEEKENKDRRLKIEEDDEGFTFRISDSAGFSQSQSRVGQGVTLFFQDEGRFVSAFHFAKPEFSFDEVRQWLEGEGFNPSDQQKQNFEAPKERHVFLEGVSAPNPRLEISQPFEDLEGHEWLRAEAVAIAEGIWKEFKFTEEVIHKAIKEGKFNNINVCEHHSFFDPQDVKGRTLSSATVDGGGKASFVVFDEDSIRKIKSEFFHSVSSNFLLTVDEDNIVTEISKVIELTLTDNPACLDAVITMSEPVNVEGFVKVAAEATSKADSVVAVFTKEKPPFAEDFGGKMSEKEQPKETSAKLEVTQLQAQLEARGEELQKVNARLEKEQQYRLEMEADTATTKWVEAEKKVAPAVRDEFRNFYLSLEDEGKKSFEAILEKSPQVLPTDDIGVPLVENVTEEQFEDERLSEDDIIVGLQALKQKKIEGAQLYNKKNIKFHRGKYDTVGDQPVSFDKLGNAFVKENE